MRERWSVRPLGRRTDRKAKAIRERSMFGKAGNTETA
jgi:hypothetical protein